MINKEEIISLLAKNEIFLDKKDPVIAFLTFHDILLDRYAESIGSKAETVNQNFVQVLKETEEKYSNQSKNLANEIVGKAVNEFNSAEHRLAELIKEFQSPKNPYEEKFKRFEIWLFCIIFLNLSCLFISFIGILLK